MVRTPEFTPAQKRAALAAGNMGASTTVSFIAFETVFKREPVPQGYTKTTEAFRMEEGTPTWPRTIDNVGGALDYGVAAAQSKYPGSIILEVMFTGGSDVKVTFLKPTGVPI